MVEDSRNFITGHGSFVDDLHLDGMLYLKVVRSPYARAKILKVEAGEGVITGTEFKVNLAAVGEGASWGGDRISVPYPVLANDYVSYVGQPVAAVLADDQYKAEDMTDEVGVDYDALKPLIDPHEALSFEPIHPVLKSNLATSVELGHDFESDAPIVLEDELANERIAPNPIEPRGMVAHYDGTRLTVWASTQSVYSWKEGVLAVTKLPRESVSVLQMDTGGAFGTKSGLYPEYAIACYASMKTKRPVKWIETRLEHLLATSHGRGASGKLKFYADRQGRVSGIKADLLIDNGAFSAGLGAFAPRWIGMQLTGPYAIDKIHVTGAAVFTNKVPLGPYRGAGRPEAAFFYERMMDLVAEELELDPVEVRLRNVSAESFTSPLGLNLEPYKPFLETAVEKLDYFARKKVEGSNIGLSSIILVSSIPPGESARIAIANGRIKVWMGGGQSGQDHEVMVRKLVTEELGVPDSLVELQRGDTDHLARGVGSWGSRTAVVGGAALIEASRKLKAQAQEKLGNYTQEELLSSGFDVTVFHQSTESVISFAANLAEAIVDRETGKERVLNCTGYYDAGRVLNPYMAESQSIGGTAQGIGQVLYEEVLYSNTDGQLTTGTIEDAGVPSATLIPNITIKLADHPSKPGEPIKGIGEASTTGVPPAVIRAIEKSVGTRLRRTPLRPEDLLALIQT